MVIRIAVVSSFFFLLAGIILWILAEVGQGSSLMAYRNIGFLIFYLIHFSLLVIKSRFVRILEYSIPAILGVLIALAGVYMISEFHPRGELVFTLGLGGMTVCYTIWIIRKHPTFFSDFLKWIWVAGLCLSLADVAYDLINGPWLDILWFTAFVVLGIYNTRDAFEKEG